jgi:hypothetical protein
VVWMVVMVVTMVVVTAVNEICIFPRITYSYFIINILFITIICDCQLYDVISNKYKL